MGRTGVAIAVLMLLRGTLVEPYPGLALQHKERVVELTSGQLPEIGGRS